MMLVKSEFTSYTRITGSTTQFFFWELKNRLLKDLFNIINYINLFVYSRKHPVTVILYKNLYTLIFQTDINRPD